MSTANNFPKLHNAMWPGLVGKGSPGADPAFELDTMLDLTCAAEVDGVRFDGVDIFLFSPHVDIDISDDNLKLIAEKIQARGLAIGSVVAPVWPPTGGGSAMGSAEERAKFVGQVRKACRIARRLREIGARPYGVVRIDSACGPSDWLTDPDGNRAKVAQTFSEACDVAEEFGERLAAEGEICWGGMHSWREMVRLLEAVNRPKTLGFQADMAHTLLYTLGYNAEEDRILPGNFAWDNVEVFQDALRTLTKALRPWTIDFHVAQNDATVKGSGHHDKTGRHCLATDPNGKLDIARDAGHWLRDEKGNLTKAFRHICWDGCMFPNEVMLKPETWRDILAAMIAVRDRHGWSETSAPNAEKSPAAAVAARAGVALSSKKPAAAAPKATPKAKVAAKPAVKAAPAPVAKKAVAATPVAAPKATKVATKPAKAATAAKAAPAKKAQQKPNVKIKASAPAKAKAKAPTKVKATKVAAKSSAKAPAKAKGKAPVEAKAKVPAKAKAKAKAKAPAKSAKAKGPGARR